MGESVDVEGQKTLGITRRHPRRVNANRHYCRTRKKTL